MFLCLDFQTSTCDAVTEAAHLATVTMDIISGYAPSIDVNLVGQSIYYCLSLGHQLEELGMDMSPVLRLLAGINPEHMKFQDGAIIAMIAKLLLIGSIQEQNFILQFGE